MRHRYYMPTRATQYRPVHTPEPSTTDDLRGSRHVRGYTAHWSRFAKAYLREHSLCRHCRDTGRIEPATCVDHIDEKGPLGERGYDPTNLQPLCRTCHSRKTARHRHARGA